MSHEPDTGSEPPAAWIRVAESARALRARCGAPPSIGVVLGSGLGGFGEDLADAVALDYRELPHWPPATAAGHAGRLIVGTLNSRRVAVLAGRAHVYEGHALESIVLPVRVLGQLGVRQIVLTNAAGAVSRRLAPGSLMVIDDHISLMGANPFTGPHDERFGPRHPDMTEVYSARLRALAHEASRAAGIPVSRGVYLAVPGPSYETPAEIRFFRAIGADAVGMSTVPEAMAARHMGLEVLGLSCIANLAAGMSLQRVSHDEVLESTRRVRESFQTLVRAIVERI